MDSGLQVCEVSILSSLGDSPAHSSILKNPEEPRNRNRRKRKGFQNFCKEMVKMKILAFVSRRPSQWAHYVCTC